MPEHHISVPRTARYYTLGPEDETIDEVWFVLHGYGQLAERFLRSFRSIDNGRRLIVAPEALSRFYLVNTNGHVGASWMTKVDRLVEIDDYVRYLDAIHAQIVAPLTTPPPLTALGFSQGTATAARWVCMGSVEAQRLILWGGSMPPDLDLQIHGDRLRRMRLQLVLGDRDEFAKPDSVTAERERLRSHAIPYEPIRYDGRHEIVEHVLKGLI
jgi:predicted esterase